MTKIEFYVSRAMVEKFIIEILGEKGGGGTEKDKILSAMKKAGEPLNAGKIAELTGLERKAVDKAMAEMKKDGSIVSPVRCKWQPA